MQEPIATLHLIGGSEISFSASSEQLDILRVLKVNAKSKGEIVQLYAKPFKQEEK